MSETGQSDEHIGSEQENQHQNRITPGPEITKASPQVPQAEPDNSAQEDHIRSEIKSMQRKGPDELVSLIENRQNDPDYVDPDRRQKPKDDGEADDSGILGALGWIYNKVTGKYNK